MKRYREVEKDTYYRRVHRVMKIKNLFLCVLAEKEQYPL